MDYSMNPLKQNIKLKQYIGWFIALFFPFAARAIMDITRVPLISALIYLGICGVFLRLSFEKKLPYFNPQFKKVKKEIVFLVLSTALCAYLLIKGATTVKAPSGELIFNAFIFALLNGSLEHLVWINIFDLAGAKIKLNGYVATFVYLALINTLFWRTFIPQPQVNIIIFIISQIFIFIIPLIIYIKTKDITIWSIQHILYNLLAVFFLNLGISTFLHI